MNAIEKIPLEQIDLADKTFSVNYMPDLQRLRSSIGEMGLIQPVLLKRKMNGYQIISGFRRISVVKELGKFEIESRVFEENEKDDLRLFSLSLHENLTTRGFNAVEKAIALDKLIDRFQIDPPVVIKNFLPSLALEPNEKILETYLSLAQMENETKQYILREEVSRSNIRRLAVLDSDDRRAFLLLASPLKLGENRLREILTFLEEISRRNRWSVRDIVGQPEIQIVLSQAELTPGQKADRIKKVLMNLRYPRMHRLEEEFERKRRDLNLPSKVLLHHQPFFEGKGLKIEVQFETIEEFRAILDALSSVAHKNEFEEMLKI